MKFIDDVLSGRTALPTVPPSILKLMAELKRDDVQMSTLADLNEKDPSLGARVLRMANTSYFEGRRSVESLADAVALIGARPLTTLLVAGSAQTSFADVAAVNLNRFWEASQQTAAASRLVAARMKIDKDAAYSAGLLGAVGHLILCQGEPDKARRSFNRKRMPWGMELRQKEESAFGVTHAQVSAIWLDRLGLPAHVVRAVELCDSGPSLAAPPLSRALQIGAAMAAGLMAASEPEAAQVRLPEGLLAAASLRDYVNGGGLKEDMQTLASLPIAG